MVSIYWEDHSVDVMRLVCDMYKNIEFTDCAVDTEGGIIHCHKTILVGCSPYLQKLFRDHHGMKIIPLKEVNYTDMKLILDFIYYGEIYVPVSDMDSLRQSAELLQISSLQSASRNILNTFSSKDTSCLNIYQQSGRGTKPCSDTKSLSKEAIEDQSKISCTNIRMINMDTVKNDGGNIQDELPPLTFVSVSPVLVKSEDLGDQESESCVTDPLLKNPLEIHPNGSNAFKVKNVINEIIETKMEIKQETEVPITENDSIIKEIKSESYLDVLPFGTQIKDSCDELTTNVEGNMFLATKCLGLGQSHKNITPYRAVSSFCSEDCNLGKSRGVEVKFESICEPDLKEEKPCLTELDVENTEDDDSPFSLTQGNEESCIVSMQDVNREIGVTTTTFNKTYGSPTVPKVSSELERELMKCSGNEETLNSSLCDPVFSSKVKCEHNPSHAADDVHFVCGNTHVKHFGNLISEKSFSCKVCDALFGDRCGLKYNMRYHTAEKPSKCAESSFSESRSLRKHERTHAGEKPFKCGECDISFSLKCILNNHMRIHSGEKPFKCGECDASFNRKGNLKSHMRTHSGEKPFKCGECDASFSHKCNLNKHMRTHSGEKPFKCVECDASFSGKGNLITHMRTHSGEKPFKCRECDAVFSMKCNLDIHMRIHRCEKPFKCGECNASFSCKRYLNSHLRTHSGEKPFKCGECDASFSVKHNLMIHNRIHTGEKPFKCGECGTSFSLKCNLNSHLRTHSREKPFKCGECDASFSRKDCLKSHMRTHTGEKLFKCGECDASFSRKDHLKGHIRTHTGEKLFKCGECDASFSRKYHLKSHMRTHTGEKLQMWRVLNLA